jgi:hypothetical protein
MESEGNGEVQQKSEVASPKLHGTRMLIIYRTKITLPKKDSNNQQIISSIVWKRKYIPPSIPMGRYAFGYQENQQGGI